MAPAVQSLVQNQFNNQPEEYLADPHPPPTFGVVELLQAVANGGCIEQVIEDAETEPEDK